MILSAQTIRKLCLEEGMIVPFHEGGKIHGRSFGLSSCGYDITLARSIIIPPKTFRLAFANERFRIPRNIKMDILDKSTNARKGLQVFNTTAEPNWNGYITLEIVNHSWLPKYLPEGMPIAQCQFLELDFPTEKPYCGKYQNQKWGVQKAIEEY